MKTGREGTAGRAKARKGDWAATWVPRQARNKTRDNNFRIPPPAHDVGGKDAEASRLSGARLGIARLSKEPGISRFRLVAFHQHGWARHGRAQRGRARQGEAAVVCKGQRIGRCPEPCGNSPCTARETFRDWPGRMQGTADRPLSRTMRRCASMGTRARRGLAPPGFVERNQFVRNAYKNSIFNIITVYI